MSLTEIYNLIGYLSAPGGPARFYLRYPIYPQAPMGAALVVNRDSGGLHVIGTAGPTPKCKVQGYTIKEDDDLMKTLKAVEAWLEENVTEMDS